MVAFSGTSRRGARITAPARETTTGAGVAQPHNRESAPASEFTDPANGNFRLKPGSVSINVGAAIPGLNKAGSASPFAGSAWDLAACEFGGKNWSVGATVAPAAFQSNMINSK